MFGGLQKFLKIPGRDWILFAEALALHLWTGLLLKVLPFRKIPGLFRSRQSKTPAKDENQSQYSVQGRQFMLIEKIRVAVQRAGRVSPWRNRCLVSSLVAKRMLNRRNIASLLSLGVSKDGRGRVEAHAWLKSGDYELVPKDGDYTVLYTF